MTKLRTPEEIAEEILKEYSDDFYTLANEVVKNAAEIAQREAWNAATIQAAEECDYYMKDKDDNATLKHSILKQLMP